MRNRILASLLVAGSTLLQTGCAVGLAPAGSVVFVPEPPPPPSPLTRDQAVAVGRSYCYDRGYECRLKNANLARNDGVWKVRFDARGRHASGKLHLEIDAFTGELIRADEKGKLRRRG